MIEIEEIDFNLVEDQSRLVKRHTQILNSLVGGLLVENETTDKQQDDLDYYCRKLLELKRTTRR